MYITCYVIWWFDYYLHSIFTVFSRCRARPVVSTIQKTKENKNSVFAVTTSTIRQIIWKKSLCGGARKERTGNRSTVNRDPGESYSYMWRANTILYAIIIAMVEREITADISPISATTLVQCSCLITSLVHPHISHLRHVRIAMLLKHVKSNLSRQYSTVWARVWYL